MISQDQFTSHSIDVITPEVYSHENTGETASIRLIQNSQRATYIFLITNLYRQLFNRSLKVAHSLGDGIYCFDITEAPISQNQVDQLETKLQELISSNSELELVYIPRIELLRRFQSENRQDKIGVLKTFQNDPIKCVRLNDFVDYVIEPLSLKLNNLGAHSFIIYQNGFILRFPSLLQPNSIHEWVDPTAQFQMFQEYTKWAKLIGVSNVSQVNQLIYQNKIDNIKWVAEGLHQRKLSKIVETLKSQFPEKRIVTIAGPSSSNKTTFAKRLAISLSVEGFDSLVIEMDDYFQDREKTPMLPDGSGRDFESICALNVDLLAERVHKLVEGESVPRRKFNFKLGIGEDHPEEMQKLTPNSFLILEGIHGLDPLLLRPLGADSVTPIYVSPLTPLSIDNEHRFPTTDLRLIRRIIRDHQFRGYSARKTIRMWTSVRLGEEKNIFPYQNNAEMFFNSSLIYELPVLSVFGKTLLAEATLPDPQEDPADPLTPEVTKEVRRLLELCNLFYPVPSYLVPHISCIREFIGGSELKY